MPELIYEHYTVQVLRLTQNCKFRSHFTDAITELQEGEVIAIFGDITVLYGESILRAHSSTVFDLLMRSNVQDMTYAEYKSQYNKKLSTENPDAGVICTIDERPPTHNAPNEPSIKTLNIAGSNIIIQRS